MLAVGSGAVGGYYGAVLHRAGHEVTFVARGEHRDAIEAEGLRVKSTTSGDFTIHPEAVERPTASHTVDLALFCVKGYDNATAVEVMAPAIGPETAILTLQNGIGSGEVLSEAFGSEKVLLGVTYVDATRTAPGVVEEYGGSGNIIFGEQDGSRSERAAAVYDAMREAGVAVELSTDVERALWSKLVYICALSGMMCIANSSMEEVLDTPATLDLTRRVIAEAAAVAAARNVGLADDVVERTMARFFKFRGHMSSSMHTDLKRGNPLEVGVLNGAVARLGKELGVATPVNEFIAACLTVANNRAAKQRG